MPLGLNDKMPEVKVRFDNNKEVTIFDFYPDEISFATEELVGLTEKEALNLNFEKDKHFIQS